MVVLPQERTTFTHMIIDFKGPDHATVAAVGCALARVGGAGARNVSAAPGAEAPAPAAKWELLGTTAANGGMDMYVDRATIRRSGNLAQMWALWDFKAARSFEGKQFLSVRSNYEYDCAGKRMRMLSTRGFSNQMGRGSVVASSDSALAWEASGTNSVSMSHWKSACVR